LEGGCNFIDSLGATILHSLGTRKINPETQVKNGIKLVVSAFLLKENAKKGGEKSAPELIKGFIGDRKQAALVVRGMATNSKYGVSTEWRLEQESFDLS